MMGSLVMRLMNDEDKGMLDYITRVSSFEGASHQYYDGSWKSVFFDEKLDLIGLRSVDTVEGCWARNITSYFPAFYLLKLTKDLKRGDEVMIDSKGFYVDIFHKHDWPKTCVVAEASVYDGFLGGFLEIKNNSFSRFDLVKMLPELGHTKEINHPGKYVSDNEIRKAIRSLRGF